MAMVTPRCCHDFPQSICSIRNSRRKKSFYRKAQRQSQSRPGTGAVTDVHALSPLCSLGREPAASRLDCIADPFNGAADNYWTIRGVSCSNGPKYSSPRSQPPESSQEHSFLILYFNLRLGLPRGLFSVPRACYVTRSSSTPRYFCNHVLQRRSPNATRDQILSAAPENLKNVNWDEMQATFWYGNARGSVDGRIKLKRVLK